MFMFMFICQHMPSFQSWFSCMLPPAGSHKTRNNTNRNVFEMAQDMQVDKEIIMHLYSRYWFLGNSSHNTYSAEKGGGKE